MLRTCQTFECLVHVVQLVEYSLTLDANLFQVGKKYRLLRFGCHLSKTFTFEIPSTTIRILYSILGNQHLYDIFFKITSYV